MVVLAAAVATSEGKGLTHRMKQQLFFRFFFWIGYLSLLVPFPPLKRFFLLFSIGSSQNFIFHPWPLWSASRSVPDLSLVLVSRQFVDITKSRIEGLLAAFSKLLSPDSTHTYVENNHVPGAFLSTNQRSQLFRFDIFIRDSTKMFFLS